MTNTIVKISVDHGDRHCANDRATVEVGADIAEADPESIHVTLRLTVTLSNIMGKSIDVRLKVVDPMDPTELVQHDKVSAGEFKRPDISTDYSGDLVVQTGTVRNQKIFIEVYEYVDADAPLKAQTWKQVNATTFDFTDRENLGLILVDNCS